MLRSPRNRAFSLVELLVVLAVISLLVAILLPALAAVRQASWRLKSCSNLHQIGLTLEQYTGLYSAYPFGTGAVVEPQPGGAVFGLTFTPWQINRYWHVLVQRVAPWNENYRVWLSPLADPSRFESLWGPGGPSVTDTAIPSYWYSTSFIAAPRVWSVSVAASPADIRAQSPSSVFMPSLKVIMYEHEQEYVTDAATGARARPLLFADGSTNVRSDQDALLPVQNQLDPRPPTLYQDTRDGIGGRDFDR